MILASASPAYAASLSNVETAVVSEAAEMASEESNKLFAADNSAVKIEGDAIMSFKYSDKSDGTYSKFITGSYKAAYSLSHNEPFTPNSTYSTENRGVRNVWRSALSYALTNGSKKKGEQSSSKYRTGTAVGDYFATQIAIWGLENEILGTRIDINSISITSFIFTEASVTPSTVLAKANTLYKDALSFANSVKDDKNNIGYGKRVYYDFSENSVIIEKSSDGNYYSPWITIKSSIELNKSDITVSPSGKATIERNDDKFRIKVTPANATDSLKITVSGNAIFNREIAYDHECLSAPGAKPNTQERLTWLSNETQTISKADTVVGIVKAAPAVKTQEEKFRETVDKEIFKRVPATAASVENGNYPKWANYRTLALRQSANTNNSISLKWNKISGAYKYALCGSEVGKKLKSIGLVDGLTSVRKGLKKGTYYRFAVFAFNRSGKVLASSKFVYVCTKGGVYTNYKTIKFKNNIGTLKVGKNATLLYAVTANGNMSDVKINRKIAVESSNSKVATAWTAKKTINGKKQNVIVVKPIAKGTCYIYVYLQNGVYAKYQVKVG